MKEAKRVRNFDNNTIQNDKKKKELSKNSHIILPHSLRGGWELQATTCKEGCFEIT